MKKTLLLLLAATMIIVSCKKTESTTTAITDTRIKDGDGNVYDTIRIGSQLWLNANLYTTHYMNGDAVPGGLDSAQWTSTATSAYATYKDDTAKGGTYGKLYNWYAIHD